MGKTLIRVDCIDQRLYISTAPTLASGGRNEDEIEFQFCALWDGFEKVAVFYRDRENVYHAAVSENRCIIPHEVLADEGWMHFGVFGVKGDITRTSEIMRYRVTEGAITEGTAPSDPTPDIYAQMLDALTDLNNRVGALEKIGGVDGEIDLSDYALKSEIPDLIPTASAEIMGGVKIGGGLVIDESGVLRTTVPILIVEEPKDTGGYEGDTVTVTVNAIGVGLTYEWWYKNPDMANFVVSEAYKDNYCSIPMTTARNGRQVYCVIRDAYGNALQTRTATLTLDDMEVGAADLKMPYFEVGDGLILENGVMSVEPEGEYELIETITIEEEGIAQVVRGELALDALAIGMLIPPSAAVDIMLEATVPGTGGLYTGSSYGNASYEYSTRYSIYKNAGIWFCETSGNVKGWGSGTNHGQNNPHDISFAPDDSYIASLRLYVAKTNGQFTVGTVIYIYGVRRDDA